MTNRDMNFDLTALFAHPWHLNAGDQKSKMTVSFWDERAAEFSDKAHDPDIRRESEEFIDLFLWEPTETILDVGAGPGTFAIPLARRVARVMAVDVSTIMLEHLTAHARRETIDNIEVKAGRWLDLTDVPAHDTVLCLNALGVITLDTNGQPRLDVALDRLRDAARRRLIILIPHADWPADRDMIRAIGLKNVPTERQRIGALYLAMIQRGMLANIRILQRPFRWSFADDAEATEVLATKLGIQDPAMRERLHGHLRSRLERRNDRLTLSYPVAQALFWWERQP